MISWGITKYGCAYGSGFGMQIKVFHNLQINLSSHISLRGRTPLSITSHSLIESVATAVGYTKAKVWFRTSTNREPKSIRDMTCMWRNCFWTRESEKRKDITISCSDLFKVTSMTVKWITFGTFRDCANVGCRSTRNTT